MNPPNVAIVLERLSNINAVQVSIFFQQRQRKEPKISLSSERLLCSYFFEYNYKSHEDSAYIYNRRLVVILGEAFKPVSDNVEIKMLQMEDNCVFFRFELNSAIQKEDLDSLLKKNTGRENLRSEDVSLLCCRHCGMNLLTQATELSCDKLKKEDITNTDENSITSKVYTVSDVEHESSSTLHDHDCPIVNEHIHHHHGRVLKPHKGLQMKNAKENLKVFPLPSSHWLEYSDMWICTCCNSKFKQFEIGEITAISDCCLVGDTFLLLHRNNLVPLVDNLSNANGTTCLLLKNDKAVQQSCPTNLVVQMDTTWSSIFCGSCNKEIGLVQINRNSSGDHQELRGNDGLWSLYNFKLWKHRITTVPLDRPKENPFRYCGVESLVSADIFGLAQARKVYRYVIGRSSCESSSRNSSLMPRTSIKKAVDDSEAIVQILLINWDTIISSNLFSEEVEVSPRNSNSNEESILYYAQNLAFPVLKLMYRDGTELPKEQFKRELLKWEKEIESVEHLYYTKEDYDELLYALRNSTTMIPRSRQTFNGMKLGFLRRL